MQPVSVVRDTGKRALVPPFGEEHEELRATIRRWVESEIVQEETFGPVLVVQLAADWDDAIRLANAVRHGLVAAAFTCVPAKRDAFFRRVRAGILKIDASTAGADIEAPFGGWKASGVGPPEHGESNRAIYTRPQAVYRGDT